MARRLLLRLRYLLPFPLSFRLAAYLPRSIRSLLPRPHGAASTPPGSRLHATSYLDGLRGLAALIVCICHYTEENHPHLTSWYGVFPSPALALEPSWIQLPFIRVVFSGRPMVHIFFVISGFALSVKALTAVRARDFERCHAILASSAFRRPIRLAGPPAVSMLFIAMFLRAGWIWGVLPTLRQQLVDWVAAVYYHVIWPWSWDDHLSPPYNVNLWTISIELCHSMLLFLVVLAFSRMRTSFRIVSAVSFVVYCLHCGKWAAAEFVGGMLLAETHLVSAARQEYQESLPLVNPSVYPGNPWDKEAEISRPEERKSTMSMMETTLHALILTTALYIAGWPNVDSSRTPGIRHLVKFVPDEFRARDPQKFWFALAAIGIVWSCGRLPFLQKKILESRFAQFAGRISFAVPSSVFSMFQDAVLGVSARPDRWVEREGSGLRGWIGIDTAFHRTLCWAVGLALLFPLVLVVAQLFRKFVDEPFMRLARKVEDWAVSYSEEESERG